ncbi:MAG TPA: hypothetical protein VKT72_03700 [Candidatus Baltobacteraceae bacterium]|nr:hypothetical protein [Candidatus Baltobacteraceae bacterium]
MDVHAAAYDIGKTGVPALTDEERSVVRSIEHYVHSPTLRFALIYPHFMVFDATEGPCSEAAAAAG